MATRRAVYVAAAAGLAVALWCASMGSPPASAQELTPKRAPASRAAPVCPSPPRASEPTRDQREEARRLTVLGHEAAIVSDYAAARERFHQAALLDPTNDNIAYQHARALEELRASAEAVREYCRFLALSPRAPQAAEVRERIARLMPSSAPDTADGMIARFRAGVEQLERHRWTAADSAFSAVIAAAPDLAEAYYDRALASAAMDRRERAARDLETYLRLRPDAEDRDAVAARVSALRRTAFVPSGALLRGVVPGLGQVYTRRPLLGVLVLAGAAGATVYAFHTETSTTTRSFTDPFGNVWQYGVRESRRPHLAAGIAAASAITAIGALEAFLYARHSAAAVPGASTASGRQSARLTTVATPLFSPDAGGVRFGVQLRFSQP
jgi:tetratricopeptide (TPR) repeat protein